MRGLLLLEKAFLAAACICCLGMTAALFVGAFARSFGIPIFFIDDVSTFLMSSSIFLGLAAVSASRSHIIAEFFTDLMSERLKRARVVLEDLVFIIYTGVLIWLTAGLAYSSYLGGSKSMGIVPVPLAIPQAIVVIGLIVLLLRSIANLIGASRRLRARDDKPQAR